MKRKVWILVFSKLYSYFETGSVYMSSELPLTIVATKIQTFPKKYFGQHGQTILATTKTSRIYNSHNGLTKFTCKNSAWVIFHRSIQSSHFDQKLLGRSANLLWPVWSDQSGHCKIHLNWQLTHLLATGNLLTCCCRFRSSLSCNKQYNIIISLLFNIYVI